MSRQLFFYENVIPVLTKRHLDWSLETPTSYEFANNTNSIPLAGIEFPAAATEYPIVFTDSEEVVNPVVILGLKPGENLYLDEQGKWDAQYIPAFVRRYPFVFSKNEDDSKFTLCIDEQYRGWNQDGHGKLLFASNEEGTDFLNTMFRFVTNYQHQFNKTLAFCQKLKELDLLEPMTARFILPSGSKVHLSGFMAIDRDKLKALPATKLAELSRTGELELMYVHLQSMLNFNAILTRVRGNVVDDEFSKEMADLTTEGSWH